MMNKSDIAAILARASNLLGLAQVGLGANMRETGIVRVYVANLEITIYPGGDVSIGCERHPLADWLAQPPEAPYGNPIDRATYDQIRAMVLAAVGEEMQ